jgi:hypothetical protein
MTMSFGGKAVDHISAANVLPVVLQTFVGILHDLEGILELGEPLPCRPGKSPSKRYHRTRETDHLCARRWSKPHECFGCFVNLMHGQSLTIKMEHPLIVVNGTKDPIRASSYYSHGINSVPS